MPWVPLAEGSRKRRVSDTAYARRKLDELCEAAAANAPDPTYLDRGEPSSAAGYPVISERQREKVVKYINELAEDFELCVQTGTLACNYFDRYVATLVSASAPLTDKR